MPIPPQLLKQQIIKRLKGKEGRSKIAEIGLIEDEMVGYITGPYGELRAWLKKELEKTKVRSKIKYHDWLSVKRQGDRQYVLVGSPSVEKVH